MRRHTPREAMPRPNRFYNEAPRTVTVPPEEPVAFDELLKSVWEEIERSYEPLRDQVFFKTDLPRTMTEGGLYLPPAHDGLTGGLPQGKTVQATVLAVGPEAYEVSPGDRIAFPRGQMIWWHKLKDGTRVGSISEEHIYYRET